MFSGGGFREVLRWLEASTAASFEYRTRLLDHLLSLVSDPLDMALFISLLEGVGMSDFNQKVK